jgi:hypothetical protein
LNYQKQKNGYHQFSAPTAHVKLLPGDGEKTAGNSEKKSTRQNVAIQAILQHKASQPIKQDPETNKKEVCVVNFVLIGSFSKLLCFILQPFPC